MGSSATAHPNFGGKQLFSSLLTKRYLFGTRASIRTPESDFGLPNNSLGNFRVNATSAIRGTHIQVGFLMTNNETWSNCGGTSHLKYFSEFGGGGSFDCLYHDRAGIDPPFTYNASRLYTAARIPGLCPRQSIGEARSWHTVIDGVEGMCRPWENRVEVIIAGGEVNHPSSMPRATMSACYGCDGGTPWQRAYNVSAGGPSWKTIRSANNFQPGPYTSAGWQVSPLPGPFTVSLTPRSSWRYC